MTISKSWADNVSITISSVSSSVSVIKGLGSVPSSTGTTGFVSISWSTGVGFCS